jgi:tRNA (guanine37-N1)-methyltransferase
MMSDRIPYLCVSVRLGEKVRRILILHQMLDSEHRIISEDDKIFFPLSESHRFEELSSALGLMEFATGHREFPCSVNGPRTLTESLRESLTQAELELLPRAYDLIGDIAVLEIPDMLSAHRFRIGTAFLALHPNFVTVLGKKGAISGTIRVREYELLAGQDKTDTIHTEYGCRIAVDLADAYFSPRLLEEHNRVAQQVQAGEEVVDMFCGVGPFALHIAQRIDARVTAIDINPAAIELLKKSMSLNRLVGSIVPTCSDIREFVEGFESQAADRVIMNHPSAAAEFIQEACYLLKKGGTVHYYDFMGGSDPEGEVIRKLQELVKKHGRKIGEVKVIRRVRDSAPYEYHLVADVTVD